MIEPSRLAAFIASRICHDLISPVASVNSALELLQEPGDAEMKAQAEQLLHNGAESAGARIQLLRYAFGSAGLSDTAADRHEVQRIVEGFMESHKPSVEWEIDTAHFSCGHARVLMNLVIMATAAVPRGGVVSLKVHNDGDGLAVTAQAKGPKARLSDFTEAALSALQNASRLKRLHVNHLPYSDAVGQLIASASRLKTIVLNVSAAEAQNLSRELGITVLPPERADERDD